MNHSECEKLIQLKNLYFKKKKNEICLNKTYVEN